MAVLDWLVKLFGFHTFSVSLLTLLVYGAIFTAVLVTDQTPNVSKDWHGLDLDQAYLDLHKVSPPSSNCVGVAVGRPTFAAPT